MSHDAIFVLSTGRCGTQWLHEAMETTYTDALTATHEPLLTAYRPRHFFRASRDNLNEIGSIPDVAAHVDSIRETLRDRPYLECGWPCFSALPWLYDALDGRMRVVHLTRHPVTTAFSMSTHNVYGRDDWILDGALTPFDAGCLDEPLQSAWPQLSTYEKCLFWWTQIHRYGLDLHRARPEIPWHTISYEDMFSPQSMALNELVTFCGLPSTPGLESKRGQKTDRFRFRTLPDDWRKILNYPETIAVTTELGYEPDDIDAHRLSQRYFKKKRKSLRRYLASLNPLRRRASK